MKQIFFELFHPHRERRALRPSSTATPARPTQKNPPEEVDAVRQPHPSVEPAEPVAETAGEGAELSADGAAVADGDGGAGGARKEIA